MVVVGGVTFLEYILCASILLEFFQQTHATFKIGNHEYISNFSLRKKDPWKQWVVVVWYGQQVWKSGCNSLAHNVTSKCLKEKIGTV